MTIEIKQLVVRAVVEPRPAATPRPPPVPAEARTPPSPDLAVDRDALVAECARLVLRELRRGRDR